MSPPVSIAKSRMPLYRKATWRDCNHLNLEPIPARRTGAKWHPSTVNKIIHEIYAESEWIENTIERLRYLPKPIRARELTQVINSLQPYGDSSANCSVHSSR
jgi:hypothetical protein